MNTSKKYRGVGFRVYRDNGKMETIMGTHRGKMRVMKVY